MTHSIFQHFKTERLTLHKEDGREYPNVEGMVTKEKIMIADASLPIEEGDTFSRVLPNKMVDQFRVLDRGYKDGHGLVDPHYQVIVEKTTATRRDPHAVGGVVYNLYGHSSRISINSTDQSVNVVTVDTSEALFSAMTEAVRGGVADQRLRAQLIEAISEMSRAKPGPRLAEQYAAFIALAANHMQLVAPFLPALAQLLSQ